jgi:hypothetical protein
MATEKESSSKKPKTGGGARKSVPKPATDGSPGSTGNTVGIVTPKTSPNLTASSSKPKVKPETKKEDEFEAWRNQPRDAKQIDAEAQKQLEALSKATDAGNKAAATEAKDKLAVLAEQQEKLGGIQAGSALSHARSLPALLGVLDAILGTRGGKRPAKKPEDKPEPKQADKTGGLRVDGNNLSKCKTGTYKNLECKGAHKHHVVPARTTRTSTRADQKAGKGQIPGTDNIDEGFSVCLSEEDHKQIHKMTDPNIVNSGKGTANGMPDGVAKLGTVINIAVEDLQALYRQNGNNACADQVKQKADEHFKNQDKNKQVNTTKNPKKDLDAKVKQELTRDTNMPQKPSKPNRPKGR